MVLIILVLVAVIGLVYFRYHPFIEGPMSTPLLQYSVSIVSVDTGLALPVFNATQGSNQQFNLTLALLDDSQKLSVPLENITLTGYNSTISHDLYLNWDNRYWNKSLVQETVFNYTSSVNPVILQSATPVSTILTLQWSNDAPVGRYTIDVDLGKFSFLSSPGEFDQSYRETITLYIIVNSRVT